MAHQRLRFLDPDELAQIGDLELIARTLVQGMRGGMHRSAQSGVSVEFAQYRPYVQGDDPRRIDWKLYGRSDRLYLKQSHEERNLTCTLLLDSSASMDYGSGGERRESERDGIRRPIAGRSTGGRPERKNRRGHTKFRYAQMLAAAIAMMLYDQKDAVGLVVYDEAVRHSVPARLVRHHLHRLLATMEEASPAGGTDTAGTLAFLGDVLPPRGMIVLISDLLHPLDAMIEHLRSLRAMRHDVIVLQISDPAERDFTFEDPVTLIDAESDAETFVLPEAVRAEYLENRRLHFERLRRECLKAEIDLYEFSTDEPLDYALEAFLRHRQLLRRQRRQASTARRG